MLGLRALRCGAMLLAPLMMLIGSRPPAAIAQEQPPSPAPVAGEVVSVVAPKTSLEIAERFSKVLEFPAGLRRVDGFDPTVLHVEPLSPTTVRVQALDQGVTTMVATELGSGKVYSIEVFVSGDARLLQAVLRRHFPNTAVHVSKVRNTILLRGWVAEPHQISDIMDIARQYGSEVLNQMRIAGPQDVQLRVKIIEAQRSAIRRFGINFVAAGDNVTIASTPGPISQTAASLALGIATDGFVFDSLLEVLKSEGLLKISAEPVLVTRSGEGARLINGGEFPIPVPQSLGTVTIEWREFGVTLESLPIVLGPTTLKQQIRAEVSERDFTTAVTLSGTTVPGLTKRTVETQTVMEFGQTLVIGGLIATRYTAQTEKIPLLGELPGIGAAFRRTRYDTAETELVVMITPEYVSPISPDCIPPGGPGKYSSIPTDRELYGAGFIEVPNYGEPCQDGNCPPPFGGWMPSGTAPMPMMQPGPSAVPMSPAVVPESTSEPGLITPPPAPSGDPNLSSLRRKPLNGTTQISSTRPLPRTGNSTRSVPPLLSRDGVKPAGYRFDESAEGGIAPASATSTKPTGK